MPRWVVGVADHDHLGLLGHRPVEIVEIERPAIIHQPEVKDIGALAEVPAQTPSLHVVGDHESEAVAWFEEGPQREVIRLRSAVDDGDVVGRSARIPGRDAFPGESRSFRERVGKPCRHELARVNVFAK